MPIIIKISSEAARPRFLRVCHTERDGEIQLGEDARGRLVTTNPARPYASLQSHENGIKIEPARSGLEVNGQAIESATVVTSADTICLGDLRIRLMTTR